MGVDAQKATKMLENGLIEVQHPISQDDQRMGRNASRRSELGLNCLIWYGNVCRSVQV